MSHPDEEQLLRYADGEESARDAAGIRLHLEACWQCRESLEELQETVGECVRYRKNVLQVHLPPPSAPWTDIHRRFDEIDAAFDRASFWRRAAQVFQAPLVYARRWTPVAVACVVICLLLYRFRQTPSVQAAELLRKAVAAADARPEKSRRIQIRTKDRRLTRLSGAGRTLLASNAADTDALRSLQVMFQTAGYDWDDPLSAKSYQAWRDRLADKQDEFVEERDAYRIRTTGSGELAAAALKIRMPDLQPVEERLEFRNREWVEITEIGEDSPPAPDAIAARIGNTTDGHSSRLPGAAVDVAPLSGSSRSATLGDELRVLAALNQVGADLGDPIEVSRLKSDILVTGVGIAPQRQQEIHDVLRSQEHVVVRFTEPVPATVQPETETPIDSTVNANILQLQARMAEQIGGRMYFAQLGTQVLESSETMMSRAFALRRLAERIPMELESDLSPQDWRLLRSLQREHIEALRRQETEIDRLLRPALGSALPPDSRLPDAEVTSSAAWQPATEELFQSARRVDKLLAAMFGAATGESSGAQLPSQLQSSLSELRVRLDAFDRLERKVERNDK